MTLVSTDPNLEIAGGLLTIDLDALRHNYEALAGKVAPARCAAVVKADAYGLGATHVALALHAAGCRTFFVAHLAEGLDLRPTLPLDTTIAVLNGLQPGGEALCVAASLVPVLNGFEQVEAWAAACRSSGRRLPAMLQVDTGMSRLGLPAEELDRLLAQEDLLAAMDVTFVMSHLACADEPEHPANAAQLAQLRALTRRLPDLRVSFANSAGILLDSGYHYDLARPGLALHGVDPMPNGDHWFRPVVRLDARVIQVRSVPAGTAVGYGATFAAPRPMRVATIAVGYADGWPRHLGNTGAAFTDGVRLPIVGRVSMDSITLDVTALPEGRLKLGSWVELIGPDQTVDQVAREAGTIAYEILTSLGRRYARRYLGGHAPVSSRADGMRASGSREGMPDR